MVHYFYRLVLLLVCVLSPAYAFAGSGSLGYFEYEKVGIPRTAVIRPKIEPRKVGRKLPNLFEEAMQKAMRKGIATYGEGNRVLAAHSGPPKAERFPTDSLFAPLEKAEIGDTFTYQGKTYTVYKIEIVHPSNLSVLKLPKGEIRLQT